MDASKLPGNRKPVAAVQITASHNPATYKVKNEVTKEGVMKELAPENGFKGSKIDAEGYTRGIYGKAMYDVLDHAFASDMMVPVNEANKGKAQKANLLEVYVNHIVERFLNKLLKESGMTMSEVQEKLMFVVDTGNAAMGPIVSRVLDKLGIKYQLEFGDVISDVDKIPDHIADPSKSGYYRKNFTRTVQKIAEEHLNMIVVGAALDGDGDRTQFTDEGGEEFLTPTKEAFTMFSMMKDVNPKMRAIIDVRTGEEVNETLGYAEADEVYHAPGWAIVRGVMREAGADIANEGSTHIMMRQFEDPKHDPIDDGLYAMLFAGVSAVKWNREGKSIRQNIQSREWYPELSEELRPNVAEKKPGERYELMPKIAQGIADGIRSTFNGARIREIASYKGNGDAEPGAKKLKFYTAEGAYIGSLLIRASNTAPKLSMTAQGRTKQLLSQVAKIMKNILAEYPAIEQNEVAKILDPAINDQAMLASNEPDFHEEEDQTPVSQTNATIEQQLTENNSQQNKIYRKGPFSQRSVADQMKLGQLQAEAKELKQRLSSTTQTDKRVNGGIDLDRANLKMTVDRDGNPIEMKIDPAVILQIQKQGITGLSTFIINIVPVPDVLPLLGLKEEDHQNLAAI
jgi:phosphomannomutase